MSLMSQSTGPIAPASRQLLIEALLMKKAGFKGSAGQPAPTSLAQTLKKPGIGSSEQRIAARNLNTQLDQVGMQAEREAGIQGRIGFANSILANIANPEDDQRSGIARELPSGKDTYQKEGPVIARELPGGKDTNQKEGPVIARDLRENTYKNALAEAPKFGVTPTQLSGFFKRKGISFGTNPKTV